MRILFAVLGVLLVTMVGALFFNPFDKKPPRQMPIAQSKSMSPEIPTESGASLAFDLVQVSPDGMAVVAGQSRPEASIAVLDGDIVLGETVADKAGSWVMNPAKPLASGNRNLRLRMIEKGQKEAIVADKTIVVLVPDRQDGQPATVAMIDGKTGVTRIMQRAGNFDGVAIDLLEQPLNKPAILRGQANKPGTVRLYAADKLIGEAIADGNGQWSIPLPLNFGEEIRADLVGADNKVLSRAIVNIAEMMADSGGSANADQGQIVVIRPGNNLWRIASQTYGDGFQYRLIFEANKNQIRNPDLIYPGQVLALPSSAEKSSKPIEKAEKPEMD
jgi:nucleoid-associated protein YgaU